MKKLIALLLAALMVFALCACGAEKAEEPAAEQTTAEAPAAEAPAAEAPAAEAAPTVDSLSIIFNCLFNETETGGQIATHFKEEVEELSGGAITVDVKYGGTFLGHGDQLSGMASGSANMCLISQSDNPDELPLLNTIPQYFGDSIANALNCFNDIIFENETTAALIQAEAEANGIKYLATSAGGANAFISEFEFSTLSDLMSRTESFGNHNVAMYQELGSRLGLNGLNVIDVFPWDLTTDFQTGIIDATQMDASALVSMQLYTDAPYWMYDNTYAAGNFITVNLDWWNGLTAEQQAVIEQAAAATSQFSLGLLQTSLDTDRAALASNGATVIDIDEEGFAIWYDVIAQIAFRDGMARGEIAGISDNVQAVIDRVCELTGLTYAG